MPTRPLRTHTLIGCCLCLQAELTDWTSSSRLIRLDRMSRQKVALEDRLGDILSRISAETQEIKELEQQLTDSEEPVGQSETGA